MSRRTPGRRIVVVGLAGSGKTTFARALAARLGLPHIELDALHWLPGWSMRETADFQRLVAAACDRPGWVLDGNYSKIRSLTWGSAETIIWLDYPFWLTSWRLLRRSLNRAWRRELLWGTNRESLVHIFLSKDNLFLYNWRKRRSREREFRQLFREPPFQRLQVIVFRRPGEAERFLARLPEPDSAGSAGGKGEIEPTPGTGASGSR